MLSSQLHLRRRAQLALSASIATIVLVSIAPAQAGAATHRVTKSGGHPVVGTVSASGPVRGARVSLVDSRGRVIANVPNVTNKRGVFVLRLHKELPRSFTVRTSGGRDARGRLRGYLTSKYSSYRRAEPVVVTAATTLAASYQTAYPKVKPATAEARVLKYLRLPRNTDLHVELALSSRMFHGHTFTRAAKQDVGAYSLRLAKHIHSGKKRSFAHHSMAKHRRIVNGGVAARGGVSAKDLQISNNTIINGTSKIVGAIPGGGAVAGPIVGAFMTAILGAEPDPTMVELKVIEGKLDDLQTSMNISLGLQHAAAVRADANAYTLSVSNGSLTNIKAAAHTAWHLYALTLKERADPGANTPGTAQYAEAKTASDAFIAYYNDGNITSAGNTLIDGMDVLASTMSGDGFESPLTLWKRVVSDDRFIDGADQQRYAQAWEYWRTVHAHMLIMNVEYASSTAGANKRSQVSRWTSDYARTGNGGTVEAPALSGWRTKAGLDKIGYNLYGGSVYDRKSGLVWGTGNLNPMPTTMQGATDVSHSRFVTPSRLATGPEIWGLFSAGPGMLGQAELGFADGLSYLKAQGFLVNGCTYLWGRNPDNGIEGAIRISDGQEAIFAVRGNICIAPVRVPPAEYQPAPPLD
ncbi:MAG: hypothetical protein JWO69_1666 [Thermoleophilia bacterium]|nr:hypothetical protein [Thermoleophilia bacterium]